MTKPKHIGAFKGHRFPPEIIADAVWAYYRFPMSLRDVEDLLAERGIIVSCETIRKWVSKFGRRYAKVIRRDRKAPSDKWHLDILVQSKRNKRAADKFFRKLFKQFGIPRVVVANKLGSYGAALKGLAPNIDHRSHKGLNNRSEGSHRPTRK